MPPFPTRPSRSYRPRHVFRRFLSQEKNSVSSAVHKPIQHSSLDASASGITQKTQQKQSRLDGILKRSPKFLHRHIISLRSAPVTHITAFLILHEITAIVPLFGLAGAFHYYHWLPTYFSEGAWVVSGVEKFGRYFRRKGWISGDEEHKAERLAHKGEAGEVEKTQGDRSGKWFNRSEDSVRIVVEFATAYAIVKALLVPRLIVSAWGAPWFAKWTVVPLLGGVQRILGRGKNVGKKH